MATERAMPMPWHRRQEIRVGLGQLGSAQPSVEVAREMLDEIDALTAELMEHHEVMRQQRVEIERLTELAEGRLAHFQHSEESRAFHFKRAERLQTENDRLRASIQEARAR